MNWKIRRRRIGCGRDSIRGDSRGGRAWSSGRPLWGWGEGDHPRLPQGGWLADPGLAVGEVHRPDQYGM